MVFDGLKSQLRNSMRPSTANMFLPRAPSTSLEGIWTLAPTQTPSKRRYDWSPRVLDAQCVCRPVVVTGRTEASDRARLLEGRANPARLPPLADHLQVRWTVDVVLGTVTRYITGGVLHHDPKTQDPSRWLDIDGFLSRRCRKKGRPDTAIDGLARWLQVLATDSDLSGSTDLFEETRWVCNLQVKQRPGVAEELIISSPCAKANNVLQCRSNDNLSNGRWGSTNHKKSTMSWGSEMGVQSTNDNFQPGL